MSALNVREITGTKDEENGQRHFIVSMDPFHELRILVSCEQKKDVALPDEKVRLQGCNETFTNKDLAVALIQIASQAVARVGNKL